MAKLVLCPLCRVRLLIIGPPGQRTTDKELHPLAGAWLGALGSWSASGQEFKAQAGSSTTALLRVNQVALTDLHKALQLRLPGLLQVLPTHALFESLECCPVPQEFIISLDLPRLGIKARARLPIRMAGPCRGPR